MPDAREPAFANLIADLDDPRFSQTSVHHALEALDRAGIRPLREHRTPERILAWIDAEFGGGWSSEAALGGCWIAEDASGPIGFCAYDVRGLPYHWLRAWQGRASVGSFGPLGVVARARGRGLGTVLAHAALFSLRERGYRQALISVVSTAVRPFYEKIADARLVENVDLGRRGRRSRTTILASGNGSNFAAVAAAAAAGSLPLEIAGLVCDRARAPVLGRAAEAGIATHATIWRRGTESRDAYDDRLVSTVAATEPQLVLALGWMHVLSPAFIARFPQMLNVHPAFLPLDPSEDAVTMPDGTRIAAFRGAHAIDDALAAGASWVGATVHRITVAVDRGAVYARLPLRLMAAESRASLDERLHHIEREVVATAVRRWSWGSS